MLDKSKLEAIIFEFDGIILETDLYHFLSWKEALREISVYLNMDIWSKIDGISRNESLDIILEKYNIKLKDQKMRDINFRKEKFLF